MDDTRQRSKTNSAGRGSGSQKTVQLEEHSTPQYTFSNISRESTPRQNQQKHETNRRQDKKAGRAAGAERRHQHRSNPTQRTGKREARRQHKTGGERAHENQRGYSRALTDVQWGSWILNDEYLSAEMLRTASTHPKWCRGFCNPTQGNRL